MALYQNDKDFGMLTFLEFSLMHFVLSNNPARIFRSNEIHPTGKSTDVMMKYYLEQVNSPIKSMPFIKNHYAQSI